VGISPEQARDEIGAALDAVDAAQDRLRATGTELVGNAFRVEMADRLETQQRVHRALSYRMFGEIADPPDGPEDPALPAGAVASQLLWKRLRITPAEVRRRFRVAARIRPRRSLTGPTLAPELPELAAAAEAGTLGEDHIREICRALDVLPGHVPAALRDTAERVLVRQAGQYDAQIVAAAGARIAEHVNPDGLFDDHDRARRRALTLHRQGPDGMSRLSGWLDPETRAYLEAVGAAVRPGHHTPEHPTAVVDAATDTRTGPQRLHDALKLALRAGIASADLGTHRGLPVTVIATTTLAELNQAAHAATDPAITMPPPARTGGGSALPMRDLLRMATDSIHYLAVFDDHDGRPLYLGRTKRIATADQRIICYARDRGCTQPGCLQPGYHAEVHHAPDWATGGLTNADSLFFACAPSHKLATTNHITTTITNTGRLAWNGHLNHAHHPDELLREESDDG
jgi:hypothetical protein